MYEAYNRTKKGGAVGVDQQSSKDFEANLMDNLKDLLEKLKSGNYKAPPVKRIYLEKGNGKKRPIGIPTFADKVMQRAVVMVLEPIYEQDFKAFSHGFRPNRSAHDAIDAIKEGLWNSGGGFVVEVDISGFFDNIDHGVLRTFLDQRVRDGVIRRAIDKWLRAGIMEDGTFQNSKLGTPQGGVISPLLANIFLHELMDTWFVNEVSPRVRGAQIVRYADDIVMCFETEADAKKVLDVTHKRFNRFGLTLHPEKTKIVRFLRPRLYNAPKSKEKKPGTFDFLGFTIYWGKGRKGYWCLMSRTKKDKLRKALSEVNDWCKTNRHKKVLWQWEKLSQKLNGHYAYFGRTGNGQMLNAFRLGVTRIWYKWLSRRSQKKYLSNTEFYQRLKRKPLPSARIIHRR